MATRKTNYRNPRNPENALYKALTKLLSGPIVNYRTQNPRQLKRHQLDKYKFKSAAGLAFKKSSYSPFDNIYANTQANQARAERYIDFDQMEYCLHGDTKIAIPGGYKSLKELADEYSLDEQFVVYSYDHHKQQIVPSFGKQARKTRTDHAWKVIFENGQEIIGTSNHRLMMRDGTYRRIDKLNVGDSLMPFYRKDLFGTKNDQGDGYRWIYTKHNDPGRRPGWIAEHTLIAEWVSGCQVQKDEVVHHKNFIKHDNNPDNLQIMKKSEHNQYHAKILHEQRKQTGWWENFKEEHSKWMKENNPAERKDITFGVILSLCDQFGFNQKKICSLLKTDPNTIKRRLRRKGFSSFESFAKTYDSDWKNHGQDNCGLKNPKYDHSLSYQDVCNAFSHGMSSNELASCLDTTYTKIRNRIAQEGFKTFTEWTQSFENHKVAKIEYYGIIDLYDLTVDEYKNFATDSVISHNTPEIASALDIYADEMTTSSPMKPILAILTENDEIREILHNLFYDILNIEFNLFGWCRSMCKHGDFFMYLDIDEEIGVKYFIGLPAMEIERIEGEDKTNPQYVQFQWNSGGLTFETWQVAHFRILQHDKFAPYGTAVLDPARRIWRQLQLQEDAMMAYRIVRSPERRVFYIDTGGIPEKDVEQHMEKIITTMKRNQVVDPDTGQVDLRYNPMCNSLETLIFLQDGRTITLKELIEERKTSKQDQWVYSVDRENNCLVPGKVVWAGLTRKNAEMVRVYIDNGNWIDVTPDHKFMLRNKQYVEAKDLEPGDKLMPIYKKVSVKGAEKQRIGGYEKIYDPFSQKYIYTHRNNTIIEQGFDSIIGKVIHHKDFDKINNNPENLAPMIWKEHCSLHGKLAIERNQSKAGRDCSRKTMKRTWQEGKITSQTFVDLWKDEKIRQKRVNKLTLQIDDEFLKHCMSVMDQCCGLSTTESVFRERLNSNKDFVNYLRALNPDFRNGFNNKLTRGNLQKFLRSFGFSKAFTEFKRYWLFENYNIDSIISFCKEKHGNVGRKDVLEHFSLQRRELTELIESANIEYFEFSKQYMKKNSKYHNKTAGYKNHTVLKVEKLPFKEDTGCITVEKYHNFATPGSSECLNKKGGISISSGIYLRNSVDEDYFIAVRGDRGGTKIDTLPGGQYTGDIEDVIYLQNKLLAALKIPRSYLIEHITGASSEDKTTLAQKDVHFARTINRLQRSVTATLREIAVTHLYTLGYRGKDLLNFSLHLNNPSKISELQELEHLRTKIDVAGAAKDGGFMSMPWIWKKIFDFSQDEIVKIIREQAFDKKLEARLTAILEGGEMDGEGGLGDLGGDLDGGEGEDLDLGGDEGGEDETLLAAPGKRYNETHTTPRSKGKKYKPEVSDSRGMGARQRHMKGQYNDESARPTNRNLWKGMSDLSSLARGIAETDDKQTIYEEKNRKQEIQILRHDNEIKLLMESLNDTEKLDLRPLEQKEVDNGQEQA